MSSRLDSLLELLTKEPDDAFLLYGIALEHMSIQNYQTAEDYFLKLFNVDPNYAAGYMQYALLKEKTGDIETARNIYKKGIETAKQSGDIHAANEMGEFLNELG